MILACRDTEKAESAKRDIVSDTHNDNVIVKKLDLSALSSIKAFAEDYNSSE